MGLQPGRGEHPEGLPGERWLGRLWGKRNRRARGFLPSVCMPAFIQRIFIFPSMEREETPPERLSRKETWFVVILGSSPRSSWGRGEMPSVVFLAPQGPGKWPEADSPGEPRGCVIHCWSCRAELFFPTWADSCPHGRRCARETAALSEKTPSWRGERGNRNPLDLHVETPCI